MNRQKKVVNLVDHLPEPPRAPRVVGLEKTVVTMIRRSGHYDVERWYVTLQFGKVKRRLERTARWMMRKEAPPLEA